MRRLNSEGDWDPTSHVEVAINHFGPNRESTDRAYCSPTLTEGLWEMLADENAQVSISEWVRIRTTDGSPGKSLSTLMLRREGSKIVATIDILDTVYPDYYEIWERGVLKFTGEIAEVDLEESRDCAVEPYDRPPGAQERTVQIEVDWP